MSDYQLPEGYKQTEIGVIPEDWDVKPLKIVSSMSGRIGWQGLKQEEFTFNDIDPFLITGMNFKDGKIRWNEVYHILEKRYQEAKNIQLQDGDILMTKDGTIGKLLYVEDIPFPRKASLNSHLLVFRPLNDSYEPKFLFYQLSSKQFLDYIDLNKSGSTFFGITQEAVGNYTAYLPSLEEQRSLSQALSDVDALIAALDKLIAKNRDLRTSTMQQLLTGKKRLPGFGEGQGCKESAIGLIPEDWDALRLGNIAPLQRGFDLPTSQIKKGDYPVVYSNGVINYHSDFMANAPGVVTGRSGTIGNVHYVSENYWPHNTTLWVTEFICSNPKYVYYLYESVKLERFGSGSGVPTLNRNDVHDWVVAIPKIEEQSAIALVLSDMDNAISLLESRLAKTQAIKQGMMQELLTGRIRLKIEK
jgi:type I restriction enzyme, S subunit